jgi:phage shock protein A
MNTFRRWTSSIVSSFESVIHQIENHEAMVSAAIREAEQNGGHAKAQLQRVKRDGQTMRQRALELTDQVGVWRERAKKLAQSDEPKALECLRRSKRIEKQVLELEKQEREHAKMEKDLARDLSVVEERLVALRQQRNIMRTRQSRAEALRLLQQVDSRAVSDIDDIFGRWEAQVSACEVRAQLDHSTEDLLHEELSTQEEEIELRHLLAEMSDNSATKE